MTKRIPLTRGMFALVDDDMFDELSAYKWRAILTKPNGTWYAARSSKTLYMHRQIMNAPKRMEVDHINGDGLCNVRSNLRICIHRKNQQNRKTSKNSTSKYKGVTWNSQSNKWRARLEDGGKILSLGFFSDPISAALAYDAAALKHFGEFARLNFPQEQTV